MVAIGTEAAVFVQRGPLEKDRCLARWTGVSPVRSLRGRGAPQRTHRTEPEGRAWSLPIWSTDGNRHPTGRSQVRASSHPPSSAALRHEAGPRFRRPHPCPCCTRVQGRIQLSYTISSRPVPSQVPRPALEHARAHVMSSWSPLDWSLARSRTGHALYRRGTLAPAGGDAAVSAARGAEWASEWRAPIGGERLGTHRETTVPGGARGRCAR
jgi:hypothetical protein